MMYNVTSMTYYESKSGNILDSNEFKNTDDDNGMLVTVIVVIPSQRFANLAANLCCCSNTATFQLFQVDWVTQPPCCK